MNRRQFLSAAAFASAFAGGFTIASAWNAAPRRYENSFGNIAGFHRKVASGAAVSIALIGDSWVNDETRLFSPLVDRLRPTWGVAAPGYVSANSELSVTPGASVTRTGIWRDVRVAGGIGPDAAHAHTQDPAASITFSSSASVTHYRIHFGRGRNAAQMRVVTGAEKTIIGASGEVEYGTALIAADGPLIISVNDPGIDGLTLAGVEMLAPGASKITVHKIGNGGATAERFVSIPANCYASAMRAIAPALAVVVLGTNDSAENVDPLLFASSIETLIDRTRNAAPNCDVLLVGPGPNGGDGTPIADYNRQLSRLAMARGFAFIDLAPFFFEQPTSLRHGLYGDKWHPNATGGFAVAGLLWQEFFDLSEGGYRRIKS